MSYKTNAMMFWSDDAGSTWHKVSDHNRAAMSVEVERIENSQRMVDGRLRRYSIAKKHTFTTSWDNFPSKAVPGGNGMGTVDGGYAGEDIDTWHNGHDGSFLLKLRDGQDDGKADNDVTIDTYTVMITSYSKDVLKRGPLVDLWSVSLTLEEV